MNEHILATQVLRTLRQRSSPSIEPFLHAHPRVDIHAPVQRQSAVQWLLRGGHIGIAGNQAGFGVLE